MAKRLLAILLLAPSLTLGQTTVTGVVTVGENADQDKVVNQDECFNRKQDNLQVTWTFNTGGTGPFTLLGSDQQNCPQSSSTSGTITAKTVTMGTSSTNNFADTQTVSTRIAAVFGDNCPTTAATLFVCVVDSANNLLSGSILLDLAAPPAPTANPPTAGDGALNVSWSQGSGSVDGGTGATSLFKVYCDESANLTDAGPITHKCADVSGQGTTDTRITGLKNGTEYGVEVTAVTQGGNESLHSNRVVGTPVLIDDFWRLYRQDGGREQGGCAAGAGGLVALLALAPLAWRWRRRRP
jgi:Fibronectin type III domain